MRSGGRLLLSAAVGLLSAADKHYTLFDLCAPALAAGAGTPYLSPHAVMLGQGVGVWMAGKIELLPVLLLIYLLRLLICRKGRVVSPIALSCIMAVYEVLLFGMMNHSGIELLLGCCKAVLSGCALFFTENLKDMPPHDPPSMGELCNLVLVGLLLLLLCDAPMLDGLVLGFAALLLILFCGRLPLWQAAAGGTLFAIAVPIISTQASTLPIFLSATAAVCVMGRFGKKRYTAALLLCSELTLLPTGLWLEQLLWLLIPPLAAGVYWILPLPEQAPRPVGKEALGDQYQALVEQVDKLQQATGRRISFYPEIASRAAELLRKAGADDINITCAKDLLGGFFLDVSFQKSESGLTPSALLGLMERACGFALATGKYHESQGGVYACFGRRPPLTVKCAALCKTKEGETVCGDSAIAFSADQSHYVLLLSDGMGSGKDAFAQSRWTVTLLQKLLRAGMNAEGAFGMVHSSLKLAQQDIAFATADLCTIDLQTGRARFIKAGAVSTFILRGEQIMEVCGVSMPLGAPDTPDVAARTEQLQAGDLILLISDGAYERKDEILYTLQRHRSFPLRKLAKQLMRSALPDGQAEDDITVLIAQICKNGETNYEYRKE